MPFRHNFKAIFPLLFPPLSPKYKYFKRTDLMSDYSIECRQTQLWLSFEIKLIDWPVNLAHILIVNSAKILFIFCPWSWKLVCQQLAKLAN